MPPTAFALVGLFSAISIVLGVLAWRVVRAAPLHGPRAKRWAIPPILAAFGAFYVIGHRLGLAVGPEIGILGFQVALLGDTFIGAAAAAMVAIVQAGLLRLRPAATPDRAR